MKKYTFPGLFFVLLCGVMSLKAQAGNSVLIWPIDPKLSHNEKATELWLENRGASTTLMQVRVFSWQQVNGQEQYQTQQQVLASPPVVRIEPGKRQMVRLINQTPPAAGQELAYRVLLDEIPTPRAPGENQAGLTFQMRYSVPLFVYGSGLDPDTARPELSWKLVNREGKQALEITNRGSTHARLSNVTLGGRTLSGSLLGYVLANASNTFPLSFPASGRAEIYAELEHKQTWRSTSSAR
ncbi:MAG TPA: molecular chaperone [Erwinia persicina]|uniref:Molecular chaperone n=1 Tax=Erwinia persicina TaxID=55211 RepID=A0A3S7TFR5_9GAMM|nr:protein CsuC [Erwinia persicina]MBC3945113.1 molecular chaperone [Erwinia persicina]MBD8107148.1 molecular chaperone [Erwinia persicina]MBD8210228.1 molecular chaperone [Erwinia persicina]QZQ50834.1 molecular chaperone [Erwinia persicina]